MRVFKVTTQIRAIFVTDGAQFDNLWLKKEIEKIPGVATAEVDTLNLEDILQISLGDQRQKRGG